MPAVILPGSHWEAEYDQGRSTAAVYSSASPGKARGPISAASVALSRISSANMVSAPGMAGANGYRVWSVGLPGRSTRRRRIAHQQIVPRFSPGSSKQDSRRLFGDDCHAAAVPIACADQGFNHHPISAVAWVEHAKPGGEPCNKLPGFAVSTQATFFVGWAVPILRSYLLRRSIET